MGTTTSVDEIIKFMNEKGLNKKTGKVCYCCTDAYEHTKTYIFKSLCVRMRLYSITYFTCLFVEAFFVHKFNNFVHRSRCSIHLPMTDNEEFSV